MRAKGEGRKAKGENLKDMLSLRHSPYAVRLSPAFLKGTPC